jgi:hypothetical protein
VEVKVKLNTYEQQLAEHILFCYRLLSDARTCLILSSERRKKLLITYQRIHGGHDIVATRNC